MTESIEKTKYLTSTFFCFSIKDFQKEFFSIECQNYAKPDFEIIENLNSEFTVIRVFLKGGLYNTLLGGWNSVFRFNIVYKSPNSLHFKSQEFKVEKNKIEFVFNASTNAKKKSNLIKDPSCLEQYTSFLKLESIQDNLFLDTKQYLKNNLDIELYLHLLKTKNDKEKEELLGIFNNFPKINILYDADKLPLINDFKSFSIPKGICNKLKIIYSIIKDSSNLLDEFYEDYIDTINEYNRNNISSPIPIKKNIFNFMIDKLNNPEKIKKVCLNCESVHVLFDYLLSINNKKIKDLTYEDMPKFNEIKNINDFIDIIDKCEKIKHMFKENEILKVLLQFINFYSKNSNIKDLESIMEKLSSIDKQFYEKIIEGICFEISNKGKKMIQKKTLKGFEMYNFINKYNKYGDFLSDNNLIINIAENINLRELKNIGGNILEEFNKCQFFNRIKEILIKDYINGILSQINN